MPVFSFTAPHITPEEEKLEREQLSDNERQELYNDLCGGESFANDGQQPVEFKSPVDDGNTLITDNNDFREELDDPERLQQLLEEMEILIRTKIPGARKKDYLDAKQRAPILIETEANPINFLRCEKSSVEAATNRMLLYWETRKKVFGETKAYQPLTLQGAFCDDHALIESGILSIMPHDTFGRGVLFFDRIRAIPPLATRQAMVRVVFYFLQVMSEDPHMQRNGYVVLMNFKGYDLYKHYDRILTKQSSVLMFECMPIKIKAEHLLTGSPNGVMSLVLPVRKHIVHQYIRLRMVVHTGTSGDKLLESLAPYGISAKHLCCFTSTSCPGGVTTTNISSSKPIASDSWTQKSTSTKEIFFASCDKNMSNNSALDAPSAKPSSFLSNNDGGDNYRNYDQFLRWFKQRQELETTRPHVTEKEEVVVGRPQA